LRVIVLGFLIREPTGGLAWHYLNYVLGLAELGYDVYYIEDSGDEPMCFDPKLTYRTSTDPSVGLQFAAKVFGRLGLSDRWAYYDAHTTTWQGPRAHDGREICETADFLLNISNWNPLREWSARVPVRALIDTDPGFTQIRNLTDPAFRRRCECHTVHFTFGANVGGPGNTVPADGFSWRATRQAVSLAAWPHTPGRSDGRYTTVMQWQPFTALAYQGQRLATKYESFPPFSELPRRLEERFELAIRGSAAPLSQLREAGWRLADIDAVSRDPWSYQSFIQASKAEFGIAKQGYVATRCGWFSERSAVYLASGRPVLHQDTGFPHWLPCGNGVFSFASPEDVVEAVSRVDADYDAQSRAARALAAEYFAADRVLPQLIEDALRAPPVRVSGAVG
jgi:hypothetical protein